MQSTWEDREYFCLSEEEFIIFNLKDGEEKYHEHMLKGKLLYCFWSF